MIKKFVLCAAIGILLSNSSFATSHCEIFRDSISSYKQLSNENPSNVCLRYNLANEYYLRNKFQEALDVYNDIIEINPKEERAYKRRAAIYSRFKYEDNAAHEYGRLIKNIPESVFGNYQMASIHENISEYEIALEYINKAIDFSDKKNPDIVWLFEKRANILQKLGRYEEAIEDYMKYATSAESRSYSAYWDIRECYEALGDKENAKEADRKWQAGLYNNKTKVTLAKKIKWKYSGFKNKFSNPTLY